MRRESSVTSAGQVSFKPSSHTSIKHSPVLCLQS